MSYTEPVKEVMVFTNGNVMVFDENGEQNTTYQGNIKNVGDKLVSYGADHISIKYFIAKWNGWSQEITYKEFYSMFGGI